MQTSKQNQQGINISLILTVLIIFNLSLAAQDENSPGWRGPQGNGFFHVEKWTPASLDKIPDIVWQKEAGYGYSSVSVQEGCLYTLGNVAGEDVVYCLDVNNGKEIWSYKYASKPGEYRGPYATPAIDGNRVYTISKAGVLICFNRLNGKILWQKALKQITGAKAPQWGIAGSPVIDGDKLILNELSWGLALDKKNGGIRWQSRKGTGGYATPVLYTDGRKRYAAIFGCSALFGVDVETGKKLWEYPWKPFVLVNAADPVVVGNRFFISSDYGKGCALIEVNNNKPQELWKNKLFSSHFNSFIYLDGYIYGNDGEAKSGRGIYRCVELNTGKETWNKKLGLGSLIAINNHLVLLTARGDLHVIKATPSAYTEVSSCKISGGTYWTTPVAANGKLFCRSTRGTLVSINITD